MIFDYLTYSECFRLDTFDVAKFAFPGVKYMSPHLQELTDAHNTLRDGVQGIMHYLTTNYSITSDDAVEYMSCLMWDACGLVPYINDLDYNCDVRTQFNDAEVFYDTFRKLVPVIRECRKLIPDGSDFMYTLCKGVVLSIYGMPSKDSAARHLQAVAQCLSDSEVIASIAPISLHAYTPLFELERVHGFFKEHPEFHQSLQDCIATYMSDYKLKAQYMFSLKVLYDNYVHEYTQPEDYYQERAWVRFFAARKIVKSYPEFREHFAYVLSKIVKEEHLHNLEIAKRIAGRF